MQIWMPTAVTCSMKRANLAFHFVDIATLMHCRRKEEKKKDSCTTQCICSNVKCNCDVNLARAQVHTGIIVISDNAGSSKLLLSSPFSPHMQTCACEQWFGFISFELQIFDLVAFISFICSNHFGIYIGLFFSFALQTSTNVWYSIVFAVFFVAVPVIQEIRQNTSTSERGRYTGVSSSVNWSMCISGRATKFHFFPNLLSPSLSLVRVSAQIIHTEQQCDDFVNVVGWFGFGLVLLSSIRTVLLRAWTRPQKSLRL